MEDNEYDKLGSDFKQVKSERTLTTSPGTFSSINYDDFTRYKLLLVKDPAPMCRTVMGQGVTFCTNENCEIKHRSLDKIEIKPGQLFVEKVRSQAQGLTFVHPTFSSNDIDEIVIEK